MDGNLSQNLQKYLPIIGEYTESRSQTAAVIRRSVAKIPGSSLGRTALTRAPSSSAHVQIAQVPDRNEPDSAGELNYSFLFSTLEKHGYQGYVGCEYKPLGQHLLKCFWTFKANMFAIVTFGFRFHKGGTGLAQQVRPAGHDHRRPPPVRPLAPLNSSIACPFRRWFQPVELAGNWNKSRTG